MDLKSLIKENKVVLIGYTDCPYTNESARTLDSLSIAYKRINLSKS
jgi:glutaredoxin